MTYTFFYNWYNNCEKYRQQKLVACLRANYSSLYTSGKKSRVFQIRKWHVWQNSVFLFSANFRETKASGMLIYGYSELVNQLYSSLSLQYFSIFGMIHPADVKSRGDPWKSD